MAQVLSDLLRSNEDAPQTGGAAIRLAQKVYGSPVLGYESVDSIDLKSGPMRLEARDTPGSETCGEYPRGLIDLALESGTLSDDDRNEVERIISDAQPSLEKTKTIGHFRLHWTEQSTNPDDNVTEADIDATAAELNSLFSIFSADFRQPKAEIVDGSPLIEINTYYDGGLHGSTSSFRNEIFLNSRSVVRDACRRRTTSAHELFHRVEYAYGYVTGTPNQRWWVEALGSWSQQYAYPDQLDYINRVTRGLETPRNNLLNRSYDACHYWKLFGERLVAGSDSFDQEIEAIRAFMEKHDTNGNDALAATTEILTAIHPDRPFENFYSVFASCNCGKDFEGFPGAYIDNDKSVENCNRRHGPYPSVLPSRDELIRDDADSWSSPHLVANSFGTDYYRFRLEPGVTKVALSFEGNTDGDNAEFDVSVLTVQADQFISVQRAFTAADLVQEIDVTATGADSIFVIVSGISSLGGQYRFTVFGPAVS